MKTSTVQSEWVGFSCLGDIIFWIILPKDPYEPISFSLNEEFLKSWEI